MADILIDNQAAPATPAAGKSVLWVDSTTKKQVQTGDDGRRYGLLSRNWATASQGPGFAADTYITNSGLLIPSFGLEVGQLFRWFVSLSKTAAGVATPILIVRLGSNQTTADTAVITLTGAAATAAAAGGHLIVTAQIRTVSATSVVVAAFGFDASVLAFGGGIDGVSGTLDLTARAGQYMGLSFNGGAAAAITVSGVHAELVG